MTDAKQEIKFKVSENVKKLLDNVEEKINKAENGQDIEKHVKDYFSELAKSVDNNKDLQGFINKLTNETVAGSKNVEVGEHFQILYNYFC